MQMTLHSFKYLGKELLCVRVNTVTASAPFDCNSSCLPRKTRDGEG